jgi:CubicO group peptidase (beta-lactamase class C family)
MRAMTHHTRMRERIIGLLVVAAFLAWPVAAASKKANPEEVGFSSQRLERIQDVASRHIDAGDFSGAVTLVARKGRLVHVEAHGLMDLDAKKPMPRDAVFRIASMTKPVVAVAILMMMEEGKLRLSDPVSKFIPEFKGMKVAVPIDAPPAAAGTGPSEPQFYTMPAVREITVRDLLTHTSGLVSGGISTSEAAKVVRKPTDTLGDYLPKLAPVPLAFQPGSRWAYSPSIGFETLGRVVEVASGQTFDKFLRQRVFEPLGMNDTFFYFPPPDRLQRMPTVYQRTPKGMEKVANPDAARSAVYFAGGGGLVSTAEDYVQFGQMLLNDGQLDGKRLLGPRTVELMRSVHIPDTLPGRPPGRSFGLSVQVVTDAVAAGLSISDGSYGWDGAFGTHFWNDPKEQIVGLLMVQTSNPNREADRDFETAVMQAIVE